jgi:hypothetical protein
MTRYPNTAHGRGLPPPPPDRFSRPVVQDGDSLTSFSYQADPARWGLPLIRKHPQVLLNYGTPNDTLTLMLARQSATISGAVTAGCKSILFRAGTNGVGTGDFATKYAQLVDAFLAADLFVFCLQIPPRSSNGASIVAQNDIISGICAARSTVTKYVADGTAIADGSYNALSGMLLDGIHHAPLGQYTSGVAQAAILDDYFTYEPRVIDSVGASAQWVTNPLMSGTGGSKSGGTGTVPNNWAVASIGVGTSFVASVIAADGGDPVAVPWLRIELSASGGGSHSMEVRADMVHPAIDADILTYRSVDCVAEVRLVGLDCTNMNGISVGPDQSRTYIQAAPTARMDACGTLSHTLVMRSSYPRSSPASHSANAIKLMMKIVFAGSFASSAGYIDIRCASAKGILY